MTATPTYTNTHTRTHTQLLNFVEYSIADYQGSGDSAQNKPTY